MIEILESLAEDDKSSKKKDIQRSPNVILMQVEADGRTYFIGGYASHQWKANNQDIKGDSSCFLFNLTQNLRFNARENMDFYQKTSIENESDGVKSIQFGNTDLIIHGP